MTGFRRIAQGFAALALIIVAFGGVLIATGCEHAKLPLDAGIGPAPAIPPPSQALLPTIRVARATGWPEGAGPAAAPGLAVAAFARNLEHPRWLYGLPNGDVLVAETESPHYPADSRGIRGAIAGMLQARAGAGGPSANRISLLRPGPNGVQRFTLLEHLTSPFGMVLVGHDLYVADTDALLRFPYTDGATHIDAPPVKLTDLPGGPIDHHWTKNVVASGDGSKLYVSVGSNSNVAENGIAAEQERAAIWEVDRATGAHRIFASGLRNPVGMDFEPATHLLWTSVNERDELGSDLVPDYMTHVEDGAFYGWPWSYYGQHVDTRVDPPRPDMVARARVPDYALGSHTASLGLAFARGAALMPPSMRDGAFIGQHGSWNRDPPSGYRVIFVPFQNGKPAGQPVPVLQGFLDAKGQAQGRPVGVAIDHDGALLVADDVGNAVWRVTAAPAKPAS